MKKKIAIIGRPNVGKSTLFNRLVGKRLAIVDDTPGVTRDRRYAPGSIGDLHFTLIDTAGMEEKAKDALETRMLAQTRAAMQEADIVLMVVDARVGITAADEHFGREVRKASKPTVLLMNKSEGRAGLDALYDAYRLGLGEPIRISAEHGEGLGELFDALLPLVEGENEDAGREYPDPALSASHRFGKQAKVGDNVKPKKLKAAASVAAKKREAAAASLNVDEAADAAFEESAEDPVLQIAIVGRPNAGKSTLINALLKEDRLLTGPEAGITRDSIAVDYVHKGRAIKLVDTAGMRKKANVVTKLEGLSVGDSLRSIQYAHVVVVVMDATMPLEKQDAAIAALVEREGRACVLALSKWDLVGREEAREAGSSDGFEQGGMRGAGARSRGNAQKHQASEAEKQRKQEVLDEVRFQCTTQLPQMKDVTLVPLSALKGKGLDKLMDACLEAYEVWNTRVGTAKLNRWLEAALDTHTPPLVKGRRLKIKYMTQSKARPPSFQLFTNLSDAFPDAYMRYLVNGLRGTFNMPGTPIRIALKTGANPFEHKKKKR